MVLRTMERRPRIERVIFALAVGLAITIPEGSSAQDDSEAAESGSTSLPYLLYLGDRDGDGDVYGVRADGRRTVQITRDKHDELSAVLSPDGRWLSLDSGDALASTDGRRSRRLPCCMDRVAFTRDGRFFAYSTDPNSGLAPLVRLVATAGGRPRELGRGEVGSFSPDGRLLALLSFDRSLRIRGLRIVDVPTGKLRRVFRVSSWEGFADIGWSPSGKSYAFRDKRSLRVANANASASRLVLRDPRLEHEDSTVRWLDDSRLGFALNDERGSATKLGVVALGGRARTFAEHDGFEAAAWSPDGRRIAYVERTGERGGGPTTGTLLPPGQPARRAVVTRSTSGAGRRVVLRAAVVGELVWSPGGQLVVNLSTARHESRVVVVGPRGRAVVGAAGDLGTWSPDGAFLDVGLTDGRLGVLSLAARRIAPLPAGGRVVGWAAASSGPADARPPAKLPPIEIASGTRLRSLAEIAEIAASGPRVAAITEQSARDCHHALAWRAGHARVIRFNRVRSCADENGHLAALALTGTKLKWYEIAYGNSSYWTLATADMTRPRAGIQRFGEESGDHGEEPGRPPPEPGNRRGVTMTVRNGAVVLTRASDGRRRTVRPEGRVVDAELEDEGLFYAFNGRGARPGNIIFVPFAKLFA